MKRAALIALAVLVSSAGPSSAGDTANPPSGSIDPAAAALISKAIGNPDPGVLPAIAAALSAEDVAAAVYGENRTLALVALEAAAQMDHPWPFLPYSAALMASRDRKIASRAAVALERGVETAWARRGADGDFVPGQITQLIDLLRDVARDERVEADLRVVALGAMEDLGRLSGARIEVPLELLDDREAAIRGAVLAMIALPLSDRDLPGLIEMADGDEDPTLVGQAAALLCENALAHGVTAPSADLEKVLSRVLEPSAPASSICPVLACLVRFAPDARAGLVATALANPDPKVTAYWDELQK